MAAGLPGVGLSGTFFIVSALVALPLALTHFPDVRSLLTQGILVAGHSGMVVQTTPVLPVLLTLGLVVCVTSLVKGAELLSIAAQRRAVITRG
jgi:hypothetical protein